MTNAEAQTIAAVLTAAESARLGGVSAPLDPTTLKDKDVNAEVAIMFKEYLAFVIAGNHPAGVTDTTWTDGFPQIPEGSPATGGAPVLPPPLAAALQSVPPSQLQAVMSALPGLLAPLLAANPAFAPVAAAALPLLQNLLGGGTAPPAAPKP